MAKRVVQVLVAGYGPVGPGDRADTDLVLGRQPSLGSGVIVDSGGCIMTNAHVISNGGSPEGLRNSVTMGIVSVVARQNARMVS